ncbi:MAG TPA: glycosyltransferase family 1 protein [Polyangiales bacterium]|nr:glycosyltransferase family 1 protein [Polyangiales bacterium]
MPHGILHFAEREAQPSSSVINGRFLAKPHSGVSRVGLELLRALAEELAADARSAQRLRVAVPAQAALTLPDHTLLRTRGFASNLGVQLALPALYPGATVISFCNETPLLASGSVLWIHDTNIFDAKDSYPRSYRLWHRLMLEAAKLRRFEIVTVSAHARERLLQRGLAPERVRVIHNGGDHILRAPEDSSVLEQVGLGGRDYILVVGSPARHKNVPFAIEALLPLCSSQRRLAVLGLSQAGPYADAGALAGDPRVTILPRVSDGQLRALYRQAQVVLSPSLCEGFGLYAAEAMFADSGPLVLSNRGALPEVAGPAAIYFDPSDADALRAAVQRALEPDTRSALRQAARVQREHFRWRRAAREVLDAYFS